MQSWAREYQGDVPRGQAHQTVAAKGVAEQHRLVFRLFDAASTSASRPPCRPGHVVQPLGQKLDVDLVDRAGHDRAQLAVEDFAGNQLQSQNQPSSDGPVSVVNSLTRYTPAALPDYNRAPAASQSGVREIAGLAPSVSPCGDGGGRGSPIALSAIFSAETATPDEAGDPAEQQNSPDPKNDEAPPEDASVLGQPLLRRAVATVPAAGVPSARRMQGTRPRESQATSQPIGARASQVVLRGRAVAMDGRPAYGPVAATHFSIVQ